MTKRYWIISAIVLAVVLFGAINYLAYQHAYSFTHYQFNANINKHPSSWQEKMDILLKGVPYQKTPTPTIDFELLETDTIRSQIPLEIWRMEMIPDEKGVVALFHGYGANKASLINAAIRFYSHGFTTILVDFRGAGNSDGDICTVGYKEAEDVLLVYEWIQAQYPNTPKTVLYGSSMGASAILRAVGELEVQPDALVLECPFGTLYDAVSNRFQSMGVPPFPAAACLTYWGGHHHNFSGFDFSPQDYAKQIQVPTLLLYGEQDERVRMDETQAIYDNLAGHKELVTFPELGHVSYVNHQPEKWDYHVKWFLAEQLEGWDRNKPPYEGTFIPASDLEVRADILNH